MPKFTIRLRAINYSGFPVKVHIGASLIGQKDSVEYYNTSDDITKVLHTGRSDHTRYLNTNLGRVQKYDLYLVLWEGEKPIGRGKKYVQVKVSNAVEKKKKIEVKLDLAVLGFSPTSFIG